MNTVIQNLQKHLTPNEVSHLASLGPHPSLLKLLEDYKSDQEQLALRVRSFLSSKLGVSIPSYCPEDEVSSPLGTFLCEKKKTQNNQEEATLSIHPISMSGDSDYK